MWNTSFWWHWLPMIGFWLVTIVLATSVLAMFLFGRSSQSPRQILDGRLAKGELDIERYRLLRAELGVRRPPRGGRR